MNEELGASEAPPAPRFVQVTLPEAPRPVSIAVRSVCLHNRRAQPVAAPLLMLHGLGISSYTFRHVQNRLRDRLDTHAVDLLGFGRSGKPSRTDYSLPGLARAVVATMDAMDLPKVTLVGHSLGGGVALLVALAAPERVERLALVGSVAYPQPEPPFVTLPRFPLAWLPTMLFCRAFIRMGLQQVYVHPDRLTDDAVAEFAVGVSDYAGAKAYQRVCRALRPAELAAATESFSRLAMPLLILHGIWDNVVPLSSPRRLHAAVPGSELHLLENGGHMLPEEEPDWVADHLRRFIEVTPSR